MKRLIVKLLGFMWILLLFLLVVFGLLTMIVAIVS